MKNGPDTGCIPADPKRNSQVDDISPSVKQRNTEEIDPRLSFLAQASAKHDLVERNFMPVDEAIDELIPTFSDLVGFPVCDVCGAQPCVNPSFCEACRQADRRKR